MPYQPNLSYTIIVPKFYTTGALSLTIDRRVVLDTKISTGATKADIKTRVLAKLGVEPPKYFGNHTIKDTSPLMAEQASKKLLDCLEKCNIILNNKNYVRFMHLLKTEVITTLKEVFTGMSDVEINQLVDDLLYLMSHRNKNETENSNYPSNARDLLNALRNNLPKNGQYAPKEKREIHDEVATSAAVATAATIIQSRVRGFQSRLKQKPENDYGMRELTNQEQKYYISKNNIPFPQPNVGLKKMGQKAVLKNL